MMVKFPFPLEFWGDFGVQGGGLAVLVVAGGCPAQSQRFFPKNLAWFPLILKWEKEKKIKKSLLATAG